MKDLTPSRPYLLRAYYEWLMDNQLTPHLVVDATMPDTQVPLQYVKDGQIVLNVAGSAVGGLKLGNEFVEFNARFGGVPQQVLLPMASIVAIYARENGAGTVFDMEDAYLLEEGEESLLNVVEEVEQPRTEAETEPAADKPKRRGHLTLVK
ncbi:stringent starvation protein B [Shewanella algae]|jgi:stringent starvation protein B|uniref:ClpXP protease specificity-enhancing factor n=1 Tax=Shewanella chilikensis TaxID=558541 RepID=A0A6G7LNE6_9GAMM|nr:MULTISPECIES: ClpXP protease specificity-enhancing factor [Shewanella]MBO2644145.1 ClpXP protease specificity-enhancing factor [Shewanella algae]MBZ4680585.1 ClpXP protease specificity-enhancing factor [Shewanella sp.]MCA0948872.1 ClpXP protease specificity-enhancing factor [Shewanella chilikensis]MCE9854327.1 ClpXP protease specificity-enhancing factor [Shewanella chilikensis]MCL1153830.1 ClpXP protease specificity-enhancing factor [Shewanella chilikensis]